ncbi:MAG: hypothetical protein GC164_04300 [Phycisphaera sp.]|nr:hypothetical protein [Phycisphaera sp.]
MKTTKHNQPVMTASDPRRKGSVLILVVVIIVMLVLLGISWMGMARMDRKATALVTPNYIDSVVAAIINQIAGVLADDVRDPTTGYMFQQSKNIETFDMPWTDSTASWTTAPSAVLSGGITGPSADGNKNDDIWLASTAPTSAGVWPHITNLNGVFLRLPTGGNKTPTEAMVNNTDSNERWRRDTDAGITGGGIYDMDNNTASYTYVGTDADGDGIRDSKWTWAPITRIGNAMFVMAVRVIDLSGRVNPYVSTYRSTTTQADSPRWWYPADLDIKSALGGAGDVDTWGNTLYAGMGGQAAWREAFWFDNAGPYFGLPGGDTTAPLVNQGQAAGTDARDGMELLNGFGLNNTGYTANIENLSDGMQSTLRGNATEADYTAVGAGTVTNFFYNNARARVTRYNGTGQAQLDQTGKAYASNIRADDLISNDPATALAARTALVNLLQQTDMPFSASNAVTPFGNPSSLSSTQEQAEQFVACLVDFFDKPDTTDPTLPQADSTITKVGSRYGMEALPFLTECYMQGRYILQAKNGTSPNFTYTFRIDPGTPIGYAIEMTNPWSSPVRNLEHVRMRFIMTYPDNSTKTVYLPSLQQTPQANDTLYQMVNGDGKGKSMAPNTGMVFYKNQPGAGNMIGSTAPNNQVEPIANMTGKNWRVMGDAFAMPMPTAPSTEYNLAIELQVKVDPTSNGNVDEWITYSRMQRKSDDSDNPISYRTLNLPFEMLSGSTNVDVPPASIPSPSWERYAQRVAYVQSSTTTDLTLNVIGAVSRSGPTVNDYASNGKDGTGTASSSPIAAPTTTTGDNISLTTNVGKVGRYFKTGGAATNISYWTTTIDSDINTKTYRFDDVGLRYPTDLMRVMWVGPTPTQTYAEVFRLAAAQTPASDIAGLADALRARMMHPRYNDTSTNPGNRWIPSTQQLMDRITTVPLLNANQAVLGKMNLNAVLDMDDNRALLKACLPLVSTSVVNKDNLVNNLLNMRQATGITNRRRTGLKGYASIGELLQVSRKSTSNSLGLTDGTDAWAQDGVYTVQDPVGTGQQVAFDGGGKAIRPVSGNYFYIDSDGNGAQGSNEPTFRATPSDREEEVRLAGYLMNLFSVRSDYFAAYVVVQGFDANDFTAPYGGSARFMVIYDRSNVTSSVDAARVVAVRRIN